MKKRKIILAGAIGLAIGLGAAGALAFAKVSVHGKFAPGTFVANVDLSYTESSQAKEILAASVNDYLNKSIKVTLFGRTRSITPDELGIRLLVDETVDSLQRTDARQMNFFDFIFNNDQGDVNLELVAQIDPIKLEQTLEKHFQLSKLAPRSATFYFDEGGALAIKEGEDGLKIDQKALAKVFKEKAKRLMGAPVKMTTTRSKPLINSETLGSQRANIEEGLNHKFSLLDPVYSDDWDLKLSDHLDWVSFKQKQRVDIPYFDEALLNDPIEGYNAETIITIEVDQAKLDLYVDEEISKWLDRPAEPVNISLDENDKVIIEGKGSDGIRVQRKKLKQSIELAVANRIMEVPIPIQELEPVVNISPELQAMGITERIAVGHTSFYGSPENRKFNIKLGAEQFNGKLIAPDEIFSFNATLGRVDRSTGYRKELVIKKEGTIPEYGGGICQVSTTMYRAMLFADLETVERNEHSYAVSYYAQILGAGLDATIYIGGPDLQFKNNTENTLLIQTYTAEEDQELYIVFYGTETGKTVELEGPYISNYRSSGPTVYIETDKLPLGQTKQVERAHQGFDVLWYKHTTDRDGNVTTEPIETRYRAVPSKIWVGNQS